VVAVAPQDASSCSVREDNQRIGRERSILLSPGQNPITEIGIVSNLFAVAL
jgi:hypothetical protein